MQENPWQMKPWEDPIQVLLVSWVIAFALFMLMLVGPIWNDTGAPQQWTAFDTVVTTVSAVIAAIGTIMSFVMAPTAEARRQALNEQNGKA